MSRSRGQLALLPPGWAQSRGSPWCRTRGHDDAGAGTAGPKVRGGAAGCGRKLSRTGPLALCARTWELCSII
eukprot:10439149-Heterocapsa_arctica.AAC.1